MTRNIMFQAATSSAGKSTLTALLCRELSLKGIKVAPFKAQNLSLNSFVTREGGEIGISQAYQAWACGVEPRNDMNPILLKPKGNGMQIVLDGRPYQDIDRHSHVDREELLAHIRDAYLRLCEDFDAIVIEGSGSPAEVNLRDKDVANMATARMLRAPVVLIGDIDKGGVFAGLYGTYNLLEERDRGLVKGFIINKFRGEEGILQSGIQRLEREMRCHCLGVLPYHRFQAPAEDSMELGLQATGEGGDGDVREMWRKGLEDLSRVVVPHLDMTRVERIMRDGV